jgi:N-acetylmuramoyl-L-alanine amidase
MATTTTNPSLAGNSPPTGVSVPAWPQGGAPGVSTDPPPNDFPEHDSSEQKPSKLDALQALLAFASLHEQVRRRKALAARNNGFDTVKPVAEFDESERFVLDDVLQLVAERAVAITGADGLAIALAENNEIVLRAAAGTVRPDVGARIDRDSAFSGACFRTAQVVNCDDTETDARVNLQACRRLGARAMVAVPLCGRRRVIGLLEAFSAWPFGFNDSDVRNLSLLAELVVGALKPEDEDRFAESAQVAATMLEPSAATAATPASAPGITAQVVSAPIIAAPVIAPPTTAAPVISAPVIAPQGARPQFSVPPASIAVKPIEAEVASVSPLSILDAPSIPYAPGIQEAPAIDTASHEVAEAPELGLTTATDLAPESTVEPHLTFGQTTPEPATHRPSMLVVLIGILIAAAFAAGVWWKWKTAQLGEVMIPTETTQTEKLAPQPGGAPGPTTAASPSKSAPAGATAANANPDAISAVTEPVPAPATSQELAKFPRVTGIRHWSSADSSTVVLDLEDQVQYEAHRLANPDRIYFDLHDTQLAPELAGKSIEVGDTLLNRIRVAQPVAGMTRIVLEIKNNANFSVSLEPNPYRLVVEVRKIGAAPKGAVNLFPNAEAERNRLAIVIPPPTKEDLQLRARVPKLRIVVDAGHGGWDLGTVGRRGLLEKDLVLEIAERLGKLLESRLGMNVIYTRQDDNYIALDERAEIANQAQADLFVSVHANYSDLPSARGVETYYTNSFSAPGSKEAGSKDTSSTNAGAAGAKNAVSPALTSADLHERIEQSRRLAASVQRSLYGTLSVQNPGLRDRGIKEAGFVVLTESAMPGILAEVSFVSSPTDEQKLRSDGYREQIAEALYRGIARYAVSAKGVKMASAAK